MIASFFSRVIIPVAILTMVAGSCIYFTAVTTDYLIYAPTFILVSVVGFFCGISVTLFIIRLFIPNFYDFRFWDKTCYSSLLREELKLWWPLLRYGKILRGVYFLFVGLFLFGSIFLTIVGTGVYQCYHLSNFGVETKAVIESYNSYRKKGGVTKKVSVVFKTKEGGAATANFFVQEAFLEGDSVSIIYSKKRPAIAKLVKGPCRMW